MSNPLAAPILNLVSSGIDSIFGYKNNKLKTEVEKLNIELEMEQLEMLKQHMQVELEKYVMDYNLQVDSDFRDFVVEYEGAAKDVHPAVQILRAIIRPLVTIWAVGVISFLMFSDQSNVQHVAANMRQIPDDLWGIFFIVFAFWFGGRALQQVMDGYSKGKVDQTREQVQGEAAVENERTRQEEIRVGGGVVEEKPMTHFTPTERKKAFKAPSRRGRPGGRR